MAADLRHRALRGVDEQQHAVDHIHDALHLATKVRVAGRVDEIDLGVLPSHARTLGHDRDAALLRPASPFSALTARGALQGRL
jgi:hypothetical protein